jgi:hypothetical protein
MVVCLSVTTAVGQKPCDLSSFRISTHSGTLVPARLHQNVEDLSFTIERAPQLHVFAVHRKEDFIEMPAHIGTWMCFP